MTRFDLLFCMVASLVAGYCLHDPEPVVEQGYGVAEIQTLNQLAAASVNQPSTMPANKPVATSKKMLQRQADAYSKVYGLTQESDMQPIRWEGK
jgi:hypothetical protein